MSEKRFIVVDHSTCVFDNITKEEYVCIDRDEAFLVCKRLNDQQAIITILKEMNDDKGKRIVSLIRTNKKLEEENGNLREDRKVANDFIVKKGLDVEYYKHWRGLQDG